MWGEERFRDSRGKKKKRRKYEKGNFQKYRVIFAVINIRVAKRPCG